ncbi:PSD1 and planctomycete cytochrome C domain-containing protein [Mariniblastus sp.]|nr:PSD1 and planctomycete cytochrome C domain-containing protein [Mariniblastus sp.]MDB4756353.1 PSD1 and planctomycete cytochrome C domain-containing protein [Mariniblastus sp.]
MSFIVGLFGALGDVSWSQDETVDFNRDIRPLLSDRCFKCHGPDAEAREGDLRLDQASGDESPFADREEDAVITPHRLSESTLWNRINSGDPDVLMPPADSKKKTLTAEEKALIKKWILAGAKFQKHWSFAGGKKPPIPKSLPPAWDHGDIDRFVFDNLRRKGLAPKQSAEKRIQIRRLSLDLIGLPPTVQEIDGFLKDDSPESYERLVDRLLQRKGFGEHMARFWLDLVRFADTNGIHHDHAREVTPYRDWVIDAFNNNLPFDQFVADQIAGDLYDSPTTDQLVASGFNRLHLIIDRGTALPEESFHRNVVDRVTAFGTVFLGLTVQCAQCHDHKYDPISQKDFYRLYAFFNNIDAAPETPGRNRHPPFISVPSSAQSELMAVNQGVADSSRKKLKQLEKLLENEKSDKEKIESEIAETQKQMDLAAKKIAAILKTAPTTLVMKERPDIRETRIRIRGAYDQLGEKVSRGTPDFLPPLQSREEVPTRMDLANWVTDPGNPLTARVAVNRIWQQFFGVGLVKTSEDFGAQGEVPSHPLLLDHLAIRFVENDWDIKSLVKEIVMSQAYRQSSVASPEEYRRDRENRRLARGSRFRLDAETIRDQILMVSGLLNREMYGLSVKPPQPPNLWKSVSMKSSSTYSFQADTGEKILRRSLYSFWKRAMPPPQMTIFDAPTRESCIARRERTNTPLQALVLMNEEQYFMAAKKLALKLIQSFDDDQQRIDYLYQSLTARKPDAAESKLLADGLAQLKAGYREDQELTKLITGGLPVEQTEDRIEFAALSALINSVLNLDVAKTRD